MALMTALLTLSLTSLLVIVGVGQLEDQILPSTILRLLVQASALAVMCLATLASSVLFVWQTWLRWTVKVSDGPSNKDAYANVVAVRLDPAQGLVMDVLDNNRIVPTLVSPNYWQFLPSSALSRSDGLESAVLGSILTSVKPKSEPASLVALSNGKVIVGFGSRVKYLGKTYLLTANHVWNGNSEKMFLAKHGVQTEVSLEAPIAFGCLHRMVDFVLVEVPDKIWARLEVKASPLSIMQKQSMVTVYGGTDTLSLTCSSGRANKGEFSHDIVHTCTTTTGWSGSPLYYKGAVVGIHCGAKEFGFANRGVNVGILLSSGLETVYSEITNTLIGEEEARDRDYDFLEVDIIGRGRVGIGKGEYYTPAINDHSRTIPEILSWENSMRAAGKPLWSELESNDIFYDSLETLSGHLNCQRAEAPRRSLPSSLLESMIGSEETSSHKEVCHCTELVARVSSLEKVIEKLLELRSSPPPESSPSSPSSTGPKGVPVPSTSPSCSKQGDSKRPRNRKTSKQPVQDCKGSTPSQNPGPALGEKHGTTATSRRRLRRSAKATSTSKPPPVSHSVSSGKQTVGS